MHRRNQQNRPRANRRNVSDVHGIVHAVVHSLGIRSHDPIVWRKRCINLKDEGWIRNTDTHRLGYTWTDGEITCLACLAS